MIHPQWRSPNSLIHWLLGIAISGSAFGQHRVSAPPQVGIALSAGSYLGDLNPTLSASDGLSPGFDVSLQFPGKALGPEFHAGAGQIVAQLPPETLLLQPINTFVATDYFYVDVRLRLLLLRQSRFNATLAAGAGIFTFAPKDYADGALTDQPLTRANGEQYAVSSLCVPVAAGIRYRLNSKIALGVEVMARFLQSDYVDNIGQWGNKPGNDMVANVVVSSYFRLGDPYLRRMENQIERQQEPLLAIDSLPLAVAPVAGADSGISALYLAVESAIHAHQFVYCRLRKGENPDSVARMIGLRAGLLRQLNHLPAAGPLAASLNLKVPDIWQSQPVGPLAGALVQQRVEARLYMYCLAGDNDTFANLAQRYGLPEKVLRTLNYLPEGEPAGSSLVRMPLLSVQSPAP